MNFTFQDGTRTGAPPIELKKIGAFRRCWRRLVCQFQDHDVTEFTAWSCYCNRCRKGWHPEAYFRGVFTIRRMVVSMFAYFFKS